MILFDFSSISCDISMPDSRMVRKNRIICPIWAVIARSLTSEPDDSRTVVTGNGGAFA